MNTAMALGFVTGILVVAIVCTVMARMAKKKGCAGKGEYDERQQIARCKAFTWAYAVLLVYLAVWMVFRTMEIPFFMESASVIIGALLSIAVFVGYSIFHDAYFKASESPRTWIIIISAVKLIRDGRIDRFVEERYSSYNSGIGKKIVDGTATVQELEEYALAMGDVKTNTSGRQEYLEAVMNQVMFG